MDRFNSIVTPDTSVAATLVALQNGIYYFSSFQGPVLAGVWETISTSNVSSSNGWSSFNFLSGAATPGAHPNFLSTGALITFGFALSVQPGISDASGFIGADNVNITISTVPEPSAYGMLVMGLALLFSRRRRVDALYLPEEGN